MDLIQGSGIIGSMINSIWAATVANEKEAWENAAGSINIRPSQKLSLAQIVNHWEHLSEHQTCSGAGTAFTRGIRA